MEWYVVLLGVFGLLVLFLVIGLPIPFAMGAATLPFLWNIQTVSQSFVSAKMTVWGTWAHFELMAVPLFTLLGEIVGRSQIGSRLYSVMHRGVPIRGAAAYGSVGACAGFGAVCGTSMIGALTIGSVALPEMLRLGYGRRIAAGAIAAGGTLGVLIPPSMLMIYYGIITNQSVGKLFLAGAVPGLVMAGLFMLTILVWRYVKPEDIAGGDTGDRPGLAEAFLAVAPVALIAVVIMGAIYLGIATPTESAGVAVVLTATLAVILGGMGPRDLLGAAVASIRTMGYVGILVAAAVLMGFTLNYYRVPQELATAFGSLGLPPYAVLAAVVGFFLVVGMFLEPASITFITLPTMFPIIHAVGFDLIWFAVIYVVTMEIAVLTPPVGVNLYVLQGLAPRDLRLGDVVAGSMPFVLAMVAAIGLLIAFPQLALWLPAAMR